MQVLDENYDLGNMILPMSMILLQYCPSPQRYASDYQPANYTVWLLDPVIRHCWLTALLVVLYKVSSSVIYHIFWRLGFSLRVDIVRLINSHIIIIIIIIF